MHADPHDDSEGSSFKMENNVVYESSMEIPGILLVHTFIISLWLLCLVLLAFIDSHLGFDMRENEAYTASSELQESFEMSDSICYAATEPRNLYTTVNISYGCLSVSGESSVRSWPRIANFRLMCAIIILLQE